ncbi:M56 family metallopeptidase [Clostridium tagluense]|uniref:M56 family metallopeptidase n=1 Tax=Clostridium tagluense TaxID=360422 RepID=UPI001C6E2FCF|nr:M56 family metallopeptidase [Clostridium tagluense]MBW9159408.1 M56 family metallopeptidase [Clostridium tagluense]WLC66668.1 M56 family metallopeptidase [Clostridium tagluense]
MERLIFDLLIIFKWVLHLSLISSVLVLIIQIVKRLLKNKLPMQVQYALYFLIIARLIIPIVPQSSYSIFNFFPVTANKPITMRALEGIDYDKKSSLNEKINFSGNKDLNFEIENKNNSKVGTINNGQAFYINKINYKIPFVLWLIGVLILVVNTIIVDIKFSRNICRRKIVTDKRILDIVEECKHSMRVNKNIPVVKISGIKSPAIYGLVNPKILFPYDLIQEACENDLKNIFFHELSHFKRKDIFINYLIRIICVLHWFNPFIWYIFKQMKKDIEICCDAMSLNYVETDKIGNYGITIINLIQHSSKLPKVDMLAGMLNNKSDFKRRITMIKSFKKNSRRITATSLVVLLACGIVTLTDAKTGVAKTNDKDITVTTKIDKTKQTTSKEVGSFTITSKYITDKEGKSRKVDNTDFTFENDPKLIGKWESVDFVSNIVDFKPNQKQWKEDLYLKDMEFKKEGKTAHDWETWTNGIICHKGDSTASQYFIKEIEGESYMFFEWKSGDYSFRDMIPYYYVLKKSK